jgi:hypothetical protein
MSWLADLRKVAFVTTSLHGLSTFVDKQFLKIGDHVSSIPQADIPQGTLVGSNYFN